MSTTVTIDTDILLHVYSSGTVSNAIGSSSAYTEKEHPGTNKKIEGWKWDKRVWSTVRDLESEGLAPSIWDPDSFLIPSDAWQWGIGDNKDALLLSVEEIKVNNLPNWHPRLLHGFYFIRDQDHYLYSDDFVTEFFHNSIVTSGIQYVDLSFDLKPGIPIEVRRYRFDRDKKEYLVDKDFRKVDSFTGIISDGEELETVDDDGLLVTGNFNRSVHEFFIDYDTSDLPRIYVNDDLSEEVGEQITLTASGTADPDLVDNLELIGVSDGNRNIYYSEYSPIDASGVIQLLTYANPTYPTIWSEVEPTAEFTAGGSFEYKVDTALGIVTFGDYNEITTSGAGKIPSIGESIRLYYTKGLSVSYEPLNTRDDLIGTTADLNPLHNPDERGFVYLHPSVSKIGYITLEGDMTGSAAAGYQVGVNGTQNKITATVYDPDGNPAPNRQVVFELVDPYKGTLDGAAPNRTAVTRSNGEATTFFNPPDFDTLGVVHTGIAYPGGTQTKITFSGLSLPVTTSGLYLYEVELYDPIGGIAASGIGTFLQDFLTEEGITVDPDGSTASPDFELTRRTEQGLLEVTTYDETDPTTLGVGTKNIKLIQDSVVDPDTGLITAGTETPILPYDVGFVGDPAAPQHPIIDVTYDQVLDDPDVTLQFKSYFAIAEQQVSLRAYVVDPGTGQKVYSNTIAIDIEFQLPQDGVVYTDDSQDITDFITSDLLQKTTDPQYDTDLATLTMSGIAAAEWLEETTSYDQTSQRKFTRIPYDVGASGENIALFHFDGNLIDAGPLNLGPLDNVGAGTFVDGFVNQALDTTGLHAYSDGRILDQLNINEGTLEFMFRNEITSESGVRKVPNPTDTEDLVDLLGLNAAFEIRQLRVGFENTGGTRTVNFELINSGVSVEVAADMDELAVSGLQIDDGKWRHIKMTWNTEGFNQEPFNDGSMEMEAFVDGRSVAYVSGVLTSQMDTSSWSTASEFVIEAGNGTYDEWRLSSIRRLEDTYPSGVWEVDYASFLGWLGTTRQGDSILRGLEEITWSGVAPTMTPLGWRLKSPGNAIASEIDTVTYIGTNDKLGLGFFDFVIGWPKSFG